ncbi:hypothetical protein LPJGGPFB_03157 [Ensifer adhaerens]|uniref:hypothetical protein n=1 Tax=Ensifer adhaerens TaxID=106592 RepID=UPI00156A0718|nr:hypothetical protein [Ensifer adhaerens]NRP19899.1 hypothetical protein [Ensifer adhaerens]
MSKQDKRGRSSGGERHVRLPEWLLASAAWRSLSVYSKLLYIEIKRRYNGNNNGDISLSHREAQDLMGCSNKPIPAAFKELEVKGFIKAAERGSFHWKTRRDGQGGRRATTWILTEYPQDSPIRSLIPTKDFMAWRPDQKK